MKKKNVLIIAILSLLILPLVSVKAVSVTNGGDTVVEEGNYNSSRFVAGNTVTNKANVDGLSFVAGNKVTLEGSAPYGFFAGNEIIVKGNIEKDIFVAGNEITIENANIGRDAYIAGSIIKINTTINRDLRVGGATIDLSGATINGDAYVDASVITMNENTKINGKLTYNSDASVTGLDSATITSIEAKESIEVVEESSITDEIFGCLMSILGCFITLIVIFKFIPNTKDKLDSVELDFSNLVKNSAIGFANLLLIPICFVLILIIALAIQVLQFILPISLIGMLVYAVSIYLSTIVTSYVVGKIISNKLLNKDNVYLNTIIGITLIKLLILVPALGPVVVLVALCYGLGLIFKYIKTNIKKA